MSDSVLPAIFVSHGAPTIVMEDTPASAFLRQLGAWLPRPKAILAISAHWTTARPTVSLAVQPKTIHDFGGFPRALYEMTYPAPGAPDVAQRAAALLGGAGINCDESPDRGYDHGVWNPLMLMYPSADIPVAQLSCQPADSPESHYRIGQALRPLRKEGVLVLASGTAVHNLSTVGQSGEPPAWAVNFDQWLFDEVSSGSAQNLLRYRTVNQHAATSHPTPEHFLPFFVALGAGSNDGGRFQGDCLHRSWSFGSISMASYSFTEP